MLTESRIVYEAEDESGLWIKNEIGGFCILINVGTHSVVVGRAKTFDRAKEILDKLALHPTQVRQWARGY